MATDLDLTGLAKKFAKLGPQVIEAVERGAFSGAQAARTLLVGVTPTNLGQMRNSWHVSRHPAVQVFNDAPYAGIVERGARPHSVSRAGIDALTMWARRKLGLGEAEARRVAFAVAHKLRTQGQAPTFFVRNQLPRISRITRSEVERELRKLSKKEAR
jgi:hypothetical protein